MAVGGVVLLFVPLSLPQAAKNAVVTTKSAARPRPRPRSVNGFLPNAMFVDRPFRVVKGCRAGGERRLENELVTAPVAVLSTAKEVETHKFGPHLPELAKKPPVSYSDGARIARLVLFL